MTTNAPERLLTTAEAAIALGVSAHTVRRWIHSGVVKAVRPAGPAGRLRVPEGELRRIAQGEPR